MKKLKSLSSLDENKQIKRKINVDFPSRAGVVDQVEQSLSDLPGVSYLNLNKQLGLIVIHYDVSQQIYENIIENLVNAGCEIKSGWLERLKSNWFSFIESNMRENLKAPPPACCNKPPK